MNHQLRPPAQLSVKAARRSDGPAPPAWPSYTGISQWVGASPSNRVTVYVDPTLGAPGLQNAQDLLNDADRVAAANDAIFGTTGDAVNVVVFALNGATDGTGGADHGGCDYVSGAAIEVCAAYGSASRVSALLEAELSECSMGGNLCGVSTGEALSRWCAAVTSGNALADFATAPGWAQNGMPNYVDQTAPTDQDADSTGCGMAFLSWLMSQGFDLGSIARALVTSGEQGTLAQLHASLTASPASQAWPTFVNAVEALTGGVTSDDPFGGAAQPAQLAHLAPWTIEFAGKVFAAILADVVQGKEAHQLTATVSALLATRPGAAISTAAPACRTGSRRLRR